MAKNYEIDMLNGAILPKLLKLSVPLMLSSILQLLFNAADIIVVGNFASEYSLAAVGATTALVNLMTNLFLGLSTGSNVIVSHYMGQGSDEKVSRTIHTSIFFAIASGLILTVAGVIFARQLLILMQTPPEVLELSALYLRIYFAGMVAMMIYNFGSSILRSKGDTKRPLYFLAFSGVINVILNLIFVILLKMDVAGVALATVISQCVSAGLILRCLINETGAFQFRFAELRPDGRIALKILRIGVPAGFQGVVFSLSNVVIQSSINGFGHIVMAGSSAAASIEGFVWVSMNAFSQGALTFVSQNMGAKKYSRINKIAFIACACGAAAGLILGNLAYIFGTPLLRIYDARPEVIEAGLIRMSMVCCFYFTCGLMDCIVGAIRGMGFAVTPTVVSMLGACGLRILWIMTVFRVPENHTVLMLFVSYPVSWVITFLTHLVCYVFMRRKFPKSDIEVTQ
ncbi:MAG: MATE family efflux transporter [Ruminococcus sp.]|nr:MATE family efflux transporter [Ruminococcus sp.]MCM1381561.1 MATE family efflux transporter [Muribaculaceae bacterium]MCM1479936.1 MATE family efflux transporter [Muribaculaceae bacterium]